MESPRSSSDCDDGKPRIPYGQMAIGLQFAAQNSCLVCEHKLCAGAKNDRLFDFKLRTAWIAKLQAAARNQRFFAPLAKWQTHSKNVTPIFAYRFAGSILNAK